ncbi:hypothetical protein [Brevundimonas sp.]
MTRDTVFLETSAILATSLIVGRFPGFSPARADVVSSSVKLDLSKWSDQPYNRAARDAMATVRDDTDVGNSVDTGFLPLQSSCTDDKIGIWHTASGRRVTGFSEHSAVAA